MRIQKKLSLLTLLINLLFINFSQSQNLHRWYQDGKVIFQLKTQSEYHIPSKDKIVDFENIDFLRNAKKRYGIYQVTQLHPNDPDMLLRKTYQIEFTDYTKVENLIEELSQNNFIEYAEKKELHESFLTPNDLGANSATGTGMWHLYRMNAQQAWDLSTGNPNVVVAVTDDAILQTHQDLTNKLVTGYDAPTGGSNTNPCGSNDGNHGTHVSGTVGAETNNGIGVASIGFGVSIMPVKIGNCNGQLSHGYEGVNWAANNGAHVINMSWGGGGFSNYGQNVCNAASNAGAILVAAAGNDGTSQQFYPAAYTPVIAVASTTTNDAKSNFSQYGNWITVAAPGSAIRSTWASSNTAYNRIQGTSMASPNVAGLLGLMKSYAPTASNQDLVNCLLSTAANISAVNPNFNGQLGSGRIDAFQALQCIGAYNVPFDIGITEITSPTSTVCGSSFTPEVRIRNFGSTTITSATINYSWNGTINNFAWTGSLSTGQSELVSLPAQTASVGNFNFVAYTSNPNNVNDLNNSNDTSTFSFNVDASGQNVDLTIITDCYGNEITWNIEDDNNNIVTSGGPFANVAGGATNNFSICLTAGCYTFNIFDSYGDGMFGSQWQNCSVNGNYFMRNSAGDTLFKMTAANADFGNSTSHTFCVIPSNIFNDAGVTQIISPQGFICNNSIQPTVEIRNFGQNPLTSVVINYNTGGNPQSFNWTGNLASGLSTTITLPSISVGNGQNTLSASTSSPNNTSDDNTNNDLATGNFTVFSNGLSLPFSEDFENNPFTNGNWSIINPDNDITWEIATISGTSPGNKAAKMNFFQYAQSSRRDGMISPKLNLNGYSSVSMSFEHAYRRFNQTASDSLIIYISTDCGNTFDRVFARGENGTGTLATAVTNANAFTPANTGEWCLGTVGANCFTINLDAYIGQEIFIMFEGFNSGTLGNNLFIDNINVNGVLAPVPPTANFSSNTQSICSGQTVQFTDQSSANINTWNWSFPGGNPASSNQQNPIVTYSNAGVYNVSLEVTNSFGTNQIIENAYVTVSQAQNLLLSADNLTICEGEQATISANGGTNFTWPNDASIVSTNQNQMIVSPNITTSYTVTSNGNCGSSIGDITITVNPLPSAPIIIQNGNVLSVNIPVGSAVRWYKDGQEITGAAGPNFTATTEGDYSAMITDLNGCSVMTESVNVKIDTDTSIKISEFGFNYQIYPNPSRGLFNLVITGANEEFFIHLFDQLGREINLNFPQKNEQNEVYYSINLESLSSGVYFLRLSNRKGIVTEKLFLQH